MRDRGGLRAQEKRRAALRRASATKTTPTTMPASPPPRSPPSKQTSASSSRPRRRAPIPRLPADSIHVQRTCKISCPHPATRYGHTFTLSVADSARAQACLIITSLTPSSKISRLVTLLSIVGGRRMGMTPHFLVALTESKVPRWILYHAVHLGLLPFHDKVGASFERRSTGHRTDVCPKLRQDRCHRLGATHPPASRGIAAHMHTLLHRVLRESLDAQL
ncbi:hypothetical protein HPB52_000389 [Rhipicephalus sanguineus]|uniref:Uncharacterized protein n=1 Tax=Rhipicephalus sanguineus TaxID=34632 RepID=A0A9D4PJB7_RHISA|nr:hypothetical protein HPB52_000389 [Rhipicephalus sanguineus]